jgi:hypothetical protein
VAAHRRVRRLPARLLLGGEANCAKAGTVALTVIAGPLNYVGLNPKVDDCNVPEPSQ